MASEAGLRKRRGKRLSRIARPRQVFLGEDKRDLVPMLKRS